MFAYKVAQGELWTWNLGTLEHNAMAEGDIQGTFDMEIHKHNGGSCVRYHGRVCVTADAGFSGLFWICGGLGTFESFSGLFTYDGESYKACLSLGDKPDASELVNVKHKESECGEKIFEICHTDGSKTSIIMRNVD